VYLDRLVTVTILPSTKKGRGFDPDSVSAVAKQPLPTCNGAGPGGVSRGCPYGFVKRRGHVA
jgi:hypothetical protein